MENIDAAIIAIGGDPKSQKWDNWDVTDLLRLGELAIHVQDAYGATLTIELSEMVHEPESLTQEELMEIAWKLETYAGRG